MKKLAVAVMLLAFTCWLYPSKVVAQETSTTTSGFDYVSKDIVIKDSVIQPPIPEPVVEQPAKPVTPKKVAVKPLKYNSEANGDIQTMMKAKVIAKWGESEWPAMHYILDHESGSNPYAVNKSSGACGIPQALPCSKLLKVIGSLDNVSGQLDWMINYVSSRYQTPTKAMQFHKSHNWY